MELPKQLNNVTQRVADDLRERLTAGSRVAIAAASFSIYAFEELREQLWQVDELRFIFTSPTFVRDKTHKEKREFYIPKLNRECAEWKRKKVCFKSNSSQEGMAGFLHIGDSATGNEHVYPRA